MSGIAGALVIIADLYAIFRILQTNEELLPKVLWSLGILIFPVIGLLVWLFMGPGSPRTS